MATLKQLQETGDKVTRIEGILSGRRRGMKSNAIGVCAGGGRGSKCERLLVQGLPKTGAQACSTSGTFL